MLSELANHIDILIIGFFLIAAIGFVVWVNRQ